MKCRKQLVVSCLPSSPLFSTGACAQSPCSSPRELPCSSHSNQTFHFPVPYCCFLPHPFLKSYSLPALGPRGSKICVYFPSHCPTSNLLQNPCLSQAISANWIQWRNSLDSKGSTAHSSSLPSKHVWRDAGTSVPTARSTHLPSRSYKSSKPSSAAANRGPVQAQPGSLLCMRTASHKLQQCQHERFSIVACVAA